MKFKKALAKYYKKWYEDCLESIKYCQKHGHFEREKGYLKDASTYKRIIDENSEAIEFFSQGDNAFLLDKALPEKFRGYK